MLSVAGKCMRSSHQSTCLSVCSPLGLLGRACLSPPGMILRPAFPPTAVVMRRLELWLPSDPQTLFPWGLSGVHDSQLSPIPKL